MSEPFASIRSSYRSLDSSSALEKPTSILLGISQSAADALEDVGISIVFDLASSEVFANAVDICLLAENGTGRFAATGKVPPDALREGHDKSITDLPLQPISILSTYSPKTKLDDLATAIDIASIRDLAAWPPYRTARELLDRVYNPMAISGVLDLEAPADLIPANGQYPTERVQYEVLLFDEFVGGAAVLPPSRQLGADGPLDVSQLLSNNGGYERPAIGGILTFTQSWYTKGLSLGHLIHGIALAPGESTKIAMIDWSRKVRTSATETIEEGEQLDSDLSRARSISEITSAVARETQTGQSAAQSTSMATQFGRSTGSAGVRSPFDPSSFGGTAAGVETSGTSFGASTGVTGATSWSTSSGQREVGAALAQDIVDRTHQASHSARNRRASIVREVSQTESESISTRTLTNYNHMHALTVEYYEVVQLYRTVVELSKADRCLFVPMKLIDFTQPRIVERYRQVLAANGLRGDVRVLSIVEPERLALWVPQRVGPWDTTMLAQTSRLLRSNIGALTDAVLSFPSDFTFYDIFFDINTPFESLVVTLTSGQTVNIPLEADDGEAGGPLYGSLHIRVWNDTESGRTAQQLFGERLHEVCRVSAQKKGDSATFSGKVSVTLAGFWNEEVNAWVRPSWFVDVTADSTTVVLFELQPTVTTAELTQHLQDNRLYYSQVIWRALDPATIGVLLSGYTWPVGGQAKPLVELVDPTPVAIVANYLVFRISGDDAKEHAAWLDKKNITVGSRREDQVPVPSGGVFAEAVLGRFNSAEKLDITRFWNWQDSPIPIQAPDIAAIQAGSRRDPDNTVPGQLGAPVLNIVNTPSLPDPQGMGAVLAAIQNGNMFRDMSGLAATIGLAQAGLAGAQQGATDAAAQAGKNAEVAAQFGAKLAEIAGKIIAAKFTSGASLAGGAGGESLAGLAGGISGQGAKINQGKDMDRRGVPSQTNGTSNGSSGGTGGSGGGGSDPGGGASDGIDTGSFIRTAGTWEGDATDTALGRGGGFWSNVRQMTEQAILGAAPKGGGGLASAGAVVGEKALAVIGDEAKKLLLSAKLAINGPKGAAVVLKDTDPAIYNPPSSYAENLHYTQILLDELGQGGPGKGVKAFLEVEWLDNCRIELKGTDTTTKQLKSIWFKKAITMKASGRAGNAVDEAQITLSIMTYGIDNKVAPPRVIAALSIDISVSPKTALGSPLVGTLLCPLDPFDEADYTIEDNPIGFPPFVMKKIPRTP
jgi:hypothetical protein